MHDASPAPSARRRVLITGGCGFLGRALVDRLKAAGYLVRAFDLGKPDERHAPDELHFGSVGSPESVASACANVDALVIAHMATQAPGAYDSPDVPFDINVKGTALLCAEAARRKIGRVVLISSIAVVDGHRGAAGRLTRDLPSRPVVLYGLTKHLQERVVDYHARLGHFTAVALRPAYITDADTLTDKYLRKLPSVNWQFIDRRDVASAAVAALAPGCQARGPYYLHGHSDGPLHMEVEPTERDLRWTPKFDFSAWPDDAPVASAS